MYNEIIDKYNNPLKINSERLVLIPIHAEKLKLNLLRRKKIRCRECSTVERGNSELALYRIKSSFLEIVRCSFC